jgi:uncharacterized Fe-S cluster protein YjdI/predicted GNAT family acetyltransferase
MATRDYPTEGLTVHWDPSICQHSGVCARTLPRVFRPRERPWIDPDAASAAEIAAMIDTCPSRALSYTWTAPEAELVSDAAPVIEVRNSPAHSRYEVRVDGALAGFTHYLTEDGALVFDHTLIKDAFAGQGLGSVLARGALDDVRAQGGRIVALCEYISGWLGKHPEYEDLVDHELHARILATA